VDAILWEGEIRAGAPWHINSRVAAEITSLALVGVTDSSFVFATEYHYNQNDMSFD
jgi:hypothetical protein